MKLYSWNVNGIRAVLTKGNFQTFMEEHQPDILCLQETKAKPEQVTLELPGYHLYWNSAVKAGYSGTAIFSKIKPLSVISGFTDAIDTKYKLEDDAYGDPSKEGRVISAEFEEFWVVTVYTPNSKSDLSRLALRHEQWDPAFLEHITALEASKPVVFSGDLNVAHKEIDIANPKANKGKHGFTAEERGGFDNFEKVGMLDTLRIFQPETPELYSWWTHWANARARNVGWRIDYWLVSGSLKDSVVGAAIHADVMGSDHCPVSVELAL
jgi:exodeoxyribonuclease-3